jgi:hypothetical protein
MKFINKMGDIYVLESPSGKKYVGQAYHTLRNGKKWGYLARWKAHIREAKNELNYSRLLDSAIRKYSPENFKVSLICTCETYSELNEKESYYINEYNTLAPNGYNLTTGGSSYTYCEETTIKKRNSMIGKNLGKVYQRRERKRSEDVNLPKYIRSIKDGYRISNHPTKIDVTFRSKKLSMEEKLQLTINKLNQLNEECSSSTKSCSDPQGS